MTRLYLGVIVVLTWGFAMPLAQQQPPPEAAPAHNTFVLAGCLEGPLNESSPFTLTSASPVGQAPHSRAAGAGAARGEKGIYELHPTSSVSRPGLDEAALRPHVGRRVEATVRPIEDTAPPTRTGSGLTPEVAAFEPEEPQPERFYVTAIKPVSGTCSPDPGSAPSDRAR